MTVTRHKLTSKAATVEKALRMSVQGVGKVSKPSKYGNIRTVVDGVNFASRAEAKRYQELKLLERGGEIHSLVLQPRYKLRGKNGNVVCTYVGDFQYADRRQGNDGHYVVEDVKGVKTDAFRIKAALFEDNHGFAITIIKAR